MKLLPKHKSLWMRSCAGALFPTEEIKKAKEDQTELLKEAYEEHYALLYAPVEQHPVFKNLIFLRADSATFAVFAPGRSTIIGLQSLEITTPYVQRGAVTPNGYSRLIDLRFLPDNMPRVISNRGGAILPGYGSGSYENTTYNDVNMFVSREMYEKLDAHNTRVREIKSKFDEKLITIYNVLETCKTHAELLEKSPGIYSNMPSEVKELYDSKAKRQMRQTSSESSDSSNDRDSALDSGIVRVPDELDNALAVAAFIKQ